jgi:outer membrane protein assembly factor BamA
LKYSTTKISLFILIAILISACNVLKKVPKGKSLLTKNEIIVNDKKNKDDQVLSQIIQQPNTTLLGYKLRLNMYNLARENTDSIFKAKYTKDPQKYRRKAKWLSKKQVDRLGKSFWYSGIHSFLKRTGEPPVVIDEIKAKKSTNRLKSYFFRQGYFDVDTKFSVNYIKNSTGNIKYTIITGKPSFLDAVSYNIEAPALDSLYKHIKGTSFLKNGEQYNEDNINNERSRITSYFRNHGVYNFQQQSIYFDIDTTSKKMPVVVNVTNQNVKVGDSTIAKPYKIYKIGVVNIFTNNIANKTNKQIVDSTQYKNYNLYATSKLRYRPKAITDAVFIQKDSLFSEEKRALTLRSLSNLRIFNYPSIKFIENPVNQTLNANIYLTEKEKFSFKANVDATHSNIQDIGITGVTSVSIRNFFRGAEVLEIGFRGNVGSSKQLANPDNRFFNVSEIGADMRLNFPRIFFPLRTEGIIPKSMFPSSVISAGMARQKNIGLDKENFIGSINYNWTPRKNIFVRYDLINLQYVKNINIKNYFNVYGSSYTRLNTIAKNYNASSDLLNEEGNLSIFEGGADVFMARVLNNEYPSLNNQNPDYQSIKSIKERKDRLTENNLILASSFTYNKDTRSDLFDNEFYNIKSKIEVAGNVFSLVANLANQPKNEKGSKSLFGLEYSQYAKAEFEFFKHWDLQNGKVAAFRTFLGIALPYGNSRSIPFSRSYFAGGSNDNRAWQPYSLGPGSSGGLNDFNEANMKIAFNLEFRAKLLGDINGAIFADLGNIWNVLDAETEETKVFKGIKSLENLAFGTGVGIRWDLKFFVARADLGLKTYNPSKENNQKWLKDFNWRQSVLNIGINYPF